MGFIELFLSNQISSDLYGLRGPLQYVNLIRGAAQKFTFKEKIRALAFCQTIKNAFSSHIIIITVISISR